ncbi:MAG: hypothetical protein JSS96_11895 [Bacteroidetes bacterium]|nr:hypothetical protein [Bacteroidota bacterium]
MKKLSVLLLLALPFLSCKKTTNSLSYQTMLGRMGITMGQAYTSGHYSPHDTTGTITFFNDTSLEEYSIAAHRAIKFACHSFLDSNNKIGYLNVCYTVKDSAKLATDIGTDARNFPFASLALKKLELVNYSSALLLGGEYGFPAKGITPANCNYIMTH